MLNSNYLSDANWNNENRDSQSVPTYVMSIIQYTGKFFNQLIVDIVNHIVNHINLLQYEDDHHT